MAKYQVLSGQIQAGVLYKVVGQQSVVYNGVTFVTDSTFRGVSGINSFTYSGVGTQEVNELIELKGAAIGFIQTPEDTYVTYPEQTNLKGFGIEFKMNSEDEYYPDTTIIRGFSIEFLLEPLRMDCVIERRL